MNPGKDILIVIMIIGGLSVAMLVTNSASKTLKPTSNTSGIFNIQTNSNGTSPVWSNQTSELSSRAPQKSARQLEAEQRIETRKIETQISNVQNEIIDIQEEIENIELYGEKSPYAGMVEMRKSASGPRSSDVDREYIQLTAHRKNESGISISNWKLVSSVSGRQVTIPHAVQLFFSGSPNNKSAITLFANDKAYITTGRSPIGESFLINTCTGYFEQFQTFYPGISRTCPKPNEEILFYTGDTSIFINNECMDFVDRMGRCEVQTKPLPLTLSYACQQAIVDEINYNSCITKHKNESNFYKGEWRIYLRQDEELWRPKRELILLLDENGKTVDYYSY